MNDTPTMSLDAAQAHVEGLTRPRVTKDSMSDRIKNVSYVVDDVLTICIITMVNGFKAIGKSAPADPENFDAAVGQRYAYEDAFRSLWPLEGYLLCDKLYGKRDAAQGTALAPFEHAAKVAHEVNRAYCLANGDASQLPWDQAPEWQKKSAIDGVRYLANNPASTPRDIHTNWMQFKVQDGWRYGGVKDPVAKTHPCLVAYGDLSEFHRTKDDLFQAAVRAFLGL